MNRINKLIKTITNFMRSVGSYLPWHGPWSEVLNYVGEKYPNVLFEVSTYGFNVILNIPKEYSINEINDYLLEKFDDRYKICNFGENGRLIIVTI